MTVEPVDQHGLGGFIGGSKSYEDEPVGTQEGKPLGWGELGPITPVKCGDYLLWQVAVCGIATPGQGE